MRALVVAALVCFALGAGSAFAGGPEPAKQKQAEQHFNQAQKLYSAADYNGAVKEFLQAYTLVPVNPLLFNIGQAYRLAGDKEKALSYYEKYVAFEPGGAQVAEAKDHIRDLTQAVETEKREREQAEADARAKEEADRKAREDEERTRAAADKARRLNEAHSAGSGLRTAGLVVGGIGVVALGAGIGLGAGKKFDGKAIGLIGGGAAAVVAGGVMYYLGVKQRKDAEAAISLVVPQVTDTSVGVAWITTF